MNILYLVFGDVQRNYSQAYFSICSFLGQMEESDRIFVMTDMPKYYSRLGDKINILALNPQNLIEWQGEYQFFWRAKIKAIEYVCNLYPHEETLYLDTDTTLR